MSRIHQNETADARRERLFGERAAKLAAPRDVAKTKSDLDVLEFKIASERYAVDLRAIREVRLLNDLTPIPCTPGFLLGVINVRGKIYPVIDLKTLIAKRDRHLPNAAYAIIVANPAMEVGIAADAIVGAQPIDTSDLLPPAATGIGIDPALLKGISRELLMVLDVEKILSRPEMVINDMIDN